MESGSPAVLEEPAAATVVPPARPGAPARVALGRALDVWELAPVLALALALVLVYVVSAPVFGLPFDDSYISLLFARNLAEHGMITFDGETASAGATSLLHVALLAVPIKLGAEPVKASVAFGVVSHLALVGVVYWLARAVFHDRAVAFVSGASAALLGYFALDALNGMETTLFLVTTAAAAAAYFGARSERGYAAAGALGALAVLTRPEGVLLVAALGLYEVTRERAWPPDVPLLARRLALLGAPGALALAGLAAFYGATTGSVTPGTATAKMLFFREFELPLDAQFDYAIGGLGNFAAPVLPWLAFAGFAARRREALLFAFFWVAFILLYFLLFPGGLTHYWYRYQHVFLPPVLVFGSAGALSLLRGRAFRAQDVLSIGVVGSVVLLAVGLQYVSFREHYGYDVGVNERRQVGLARYLNETVAPDETIATHDIGAIGYFTEREVIDLVGLVDPEVVDYHDGRRLREYVERVRPDYIVVFPSWEDRYLYIGLRDDPERYEQVAAFEQPGREPFVVYRARY
jgi:arabinofuranosyltransferase